MINLKPGTRVFVACRQIDMRKGFNGLAALIANELRHDPYSGQLFVFRGKRGDYLKMLYWDRTGLCLFAKRLSCTPHHAADRQLSALRKFILYAVSMFVVLV
jgi:transposase